jgi:hypothetical protein
MIVDERIVELDKRRKGAAIASVIVTLGPVLHACFRKHKGSYVLRYPIKCILRLDLGKIEGGI